MIDVDAIDPGVRTMLTGYDPSGKTFEIGSNIEYLEKRYLCIDRLKHKLSKTKDKAKRSKIRKRIRLSFRKISRIVKDMHHKTSKWLATTYRQVLLPKFQVKQMVAKVNRKIHKTTVRRMYAWSHYKFKEILRHKMKMYGGVLIDCTEEYTSKACSNCGRLNRNLGSSKIFKCPIKNCKHEIDRDLNGAYNIFRKNYHLLQ